MPFLVCPRVFICVYIYFLLAFLICDLQLDITDMTNNTSQFLVQAWDLPF